MIEKFSQQLFFLLLISEKNDYYQNGENIQLKIAANILYLSLGVGAYSANIFCLIKVSAYYVCSNTLQPTTIKVCSDPLVECVTCDQAFS